MLRALVGLVGMLSIGWVSSGHAAPCAGFTDVDSASPFCDEVQWIKNRGVTFGCTATQYCPDADVTRLQMALFMSRLGDALFPASCATGQVMKWNGAAWACAADATAGGGGTVSSVTAGTGLTGGTITSSGTIGIDASYVQRRVSSSCAAGSSIRAIAADGTVTCEIDDTGSGNAFVQGGNAFGGVAVLGTVDNEPLEFRVGNNRALQLRLDSSSTGGVSVVGGHAANSVALTCTPGIDCHLPKPRTGTISGGGINSLPNRVTDSFGSIGGGYGNVAGNDDANGINAAGATVGGGVANIASGEYSTIPGGFDNRARGHFSFAAGSRAESNNPGCFTWADASGPAFSCDGDNGFVARASGGFYFRTSPDGVSAGVNLFGGTGSWASNSDRAMKANVSTVDGKEVLERLVQIPITTWNYRTQAATIRHMGPMAQDLHAAFGLGESDKHINTVDADGVALAAIQGLNAKLEARVAEQARENAQLRAAIADLRALTTTATSIPTAPSSR